ncbi:MAG: MCE family protein, partial [Bacteroidia bacterium]|nr:MCE family protein [Bacteroidia bacterium]
MAAFKLSKEQKIGLFSILTLVSLYIVVNYLKGKDLFSNRNTYYAIYHNVEGLTPTGPVYIRGLKVGTVETIEYNATNDNFTVTM